MSGQYHVRVTGPDIDVSVQIDDAEDLDLIRALLTKIARRGSPTHLTGIDRVFAERKGESALATADQQSGAQE